MHEHGLAKELLPQIERIAASRGFVKVTRVEMIVGSLHGVKADFLAHSFEHAFESGPFEGAEVAIRLVEPGESFTPSGADEPMTANGWELLITGIEGEK